jgi:MinD-like ATPase involved in chromosome partitioning or flagellar assembly/AmiR/NasT family two-component response regulator
MTVRLDRVLIVHPDPAVRHEIESVLRRAHKQVITTRQTGSAGAAIAIAREFDPRIILLDLARERALALTLARELRRPDRLIIGLLNPLINLMDDSGGGWEAEFLRQAVRSGIDDFVPLPLSDEEISAALSSAPEPAAAMREGTAIAFFSHQGGVGTTTLAVNTALALRAADPQRTVALVDANVQFGSAAAHLGVVPERDLGDVVQDFDPALSGERPMFPLSLAGPDPGIALLASPRDPRAGERVTPEDLSRVVLELRRRFRTVVIDTAPVLDLMTLAVLDISETIVIVTEGSAPIIAGTARLLRMLDSLGFNGDRIRLVVSRFRSAADVLPPNVIAQELERAVDHVVPYLVPVLVGTHRGSPVLFERGAAGFSDAVTRIARDAGRAARGERS